MKELVEVIATSLVDHPEEVVVTETVTDKSIVLELKVASGAHCEGNSYCCQICSI